MANEKQTRGAGIVRRARENFDAAREKAEEATEKAREIIEERPLLSVIIAAAVGAAVALGVSAIIRSRR